MMVRSSRPAFIKWEKRPEFVMQEAARLARESGEQVVKVILNEMETEATIYREGRVGLKHQELSAEEQTMMAGDRKAFFMARWSTEDIKWVLVKRVKNAGW
jgi:hypothetical protein